MKRNLLNLGKLLSLVLMPGLIVAPALALAGPTIKLGHVDPASWQSSKKGAAGVIFKNIVEGESDISVELFPAKALGDENSLVQQVQEGTTHIKSSLIGKTRIVCNPRGCASTQENKRFRPTSRWRDEELWYHIEVLKQTDMF